MKLPGEIKSEIQCYVYFLFKGTLDPRLISGKTNYLDKLLDRPNNLYSCFEIFAYAARTNSPNSHRVVADYIIGLHERAAEAIEYNQKQSPSYWNDFLVLAKWFCRNSFPIPLNENYLKDLEGSGSTAVPTFAVWTNVVEVDESFKPVNSEFALKRANERIKQWDNVQPAIKFEDWELEQEIY